jgi:hypothetical protein
MEKIITQPTTDACMISPNERKQCGLIKTPTQDMCEKSEDCCFARVDDNPAIPVCYAATKQKACDAIADEERQVCGHIGRPFTPDECSVLNCCWEPTENHNVPSCFQSHV